MSGFRAAAASARLGARRVYATPASLVLPVGFYALVVAMLAGIWRVATHVNHGSIAGYDATAITRYIATTEAVTVALNLRLISEASQSIASGAITVELLRPVSVLGLRVAHEIGTAFARLTICIATALVLLSVTVGPPPSGATAVLALVSMVLAITANVIAQHVFASLSFWIRDAGAAWFLYQKFVFVLGGMLIPMEALPEGLANVARYLPFRAMAYAPGRIASGHFEPQLVVEQAMWIVALGFIAIVVFAAGERRLQVVGG